MSTTHFKTAFARTGLAIGLLSVACLCLSGCASTTPVLAAAVAGVTPSASAYPPQVPGSSAAGSASQDTLRTITVVGQGEVQGSPDVAYADVGVQVLASTVATATEQADTQMNTVLSALKAAGIASEDLQTRNYSINFIQPPTRSGLEPGTPSAVPGNPAAGQYQVQNTVHVTIRDLSGIGSVLDAAIKAGANNIYGISFGVQDTSTLQGQARASAVADAQGASYRSGSA